MTDKEKEISSADELDEIDHATECGCGEYRPQHLQKCANVGCFTAILSVITIFGNINYSYYTSIITQIEKCFGLSSSMTGFIKNVDNIGSMATVLIFSHFFRYSNKPRLFAISAALTSLGIFTFAVPHFIYGSGEIQMPEHMNFTSTNKIAVTDLCDGVDNSAEKCDEGGTNINLRSFNTGAFAIFIISELIQGVAQSPQFSLSVTYMDDNSKKNSPQHLGVMFGTRAFAPVLGFLLGAWASTIYVDLTDPGFEPRDPRFVGAWWIGFVICAVLSLLPAVPLGLFPRKMKNSHVQEEQTDFKGQLKDLPKAILRLLKNPILVLIICGAVFDVYLSGYSTFMPKYLELQFQISTSMASILTGCISVFNFCIGPIISGWLVSKFRLSPAGAIRIVVICHIIGVIGYVVNTFVGCPDSQWSGNLDINMMKASCNADCACDIEEFVPVCGSDGLNYFSPCLAGCQLKSNSSSVFTDCLCIGNGTGTAKVGECNVGCQMMAPYLIVYGICSFITSMSFIPMMTTIIRTVDERDKALSLAFIGFIMMIVSFPAPMVFGIVIDTACLVTQKTCGRSGACLLYDRSDFRYKYHGFAAGVKMCATIAFSIGWYKVRHLTAPIVGGNSTEDAMKDPAAVQPLKGSTDQNQNDTAPQA